MLNIWVLSKNLIVTAKDKLITLINLCWKTSTLYFSAKLLCSSHRTPYGLWRRILEETEAAATTRMNVSQKLLADVTESVKALKPERVAIVKQVIHYCWAQEYGWFKKVYVLTLLVPTHSNNSSENCQQI